MAVPKKRTSKAKKNKRHWVWKQKALKLTKQCYDRLVVQQTSEQTGKAVYIYSDQNIEKTGFIFSGPLKKK